LTTPDNQQTVLPPFTGPNALTNVFFHATAGSVVPGSGAFITKDANGIGGALVFGAGTLFSAPTGSLLVVWDVNFLQGTADANSQTFTDNLIAYLAAPTVIPMQDNYLFLSFFY
jgi:hypothetical protein